MHLAPEHVRCCAYGFAGCEEAARGAFVFGQNCEWGTDCNDCSNCGGHRRNLVADDVESTTGDIKEPTTGDMARKEGTIDPFDR